MHYMLDWMAYLSVRCGNLLLYLHSVTIALLILHSSLKWQFLQSCSICLSLSVKTLIFFHLKGLLHCPFKSTGSMHMSASLLHHLHASSCFSDTVLVKHKQCEAGLTQSERAWMCPESNTGHNSLSPASSFTISLFSSVLLSTLLLADNIWLLPASYCKAWWEQQPLLSLAACCPWRRAWRGDGERIWEKERVRERNRCLWMMETMVTKLLLVRVCAY